MNEGRRELNVAGLCTHCHHCAMVASLCKPLCLLFLEPQEDPSYVWAHWQPKKLPLAQARNSHLSGPVASSQLEFPLQHSLPLGLTQAGESQHARSFEVGAPLGLQAPCLQRGSE